MDRDTEKHAAVIARDSDRRVRTLILGDIRVHRESIATALAHSGALDVVGAESVTHDALQRLPSPPPEIVLIEACSLWETDLSSWLSTELPQTRIVVYGLDPAERNAVLRCAEAGAAGYVARDETFEHLIAAILSVARGELRCSPQVTATVFHHVSALTLALQSAQPIDVLTRRERDVLVLVEEGLSNKEIAVRLGIETSTVKSHVHHVLKKVNVTGRGQAAAHVRRTTATHRGQRPLMAVHQLQGRAVRQ